MTVLTAVRRFLGDFAISALFVLCVFFGLWSVPQFRPDWIATTKIAVSFGIGATLFITLLIHVTRHRWVSKFFSSVKRTISAIGKFGMVSILMYLLGLFVFENYGFAPNLNTWLDFERPTISFFAIYTSLFLLLAYGWSFLVRVAKGGNAKDSETKTATTRSVVRRIRPYAVALAVPLYFAGLVVAEWYGVGPKLSLEAFGTSEFWGLLAIYTALFLATPLALGFLLWVLYSLARAVFSVFRWIGRTETWRRIKGVRLSEKELDKILLAQRRRKEEMRLEWRIQKEAHEEAEIEQRSRDIKQFGPIIARLVWWAPRVTALAQAVSFVTSFRGLKILLSLNQDSAVWFSADIPLPKFPAFLPDTWNIVVTNHDLLAGFASMLMAGIIWMLSSAAVGKVRDRERVPFVLPMFIILLGILSTYTAFAMWNGVPATKDEMLTARRENEQFLADMEKIDIRVISKRLQEVANLGTQLRNKQTASQIAALRGHLLLLQNELDKQARSFAKVSDLDYFLQSGIDFYSTYYVCEVESGCLSNLRGRGDVAKQLQQSKTVFESNQKIWKSLAKERQTHMNLASESSEMALSELENGDKLAAQKAMTKMRSEIILAGGQNPQIVVESTKSLLAVPISNDAPTSSQRGALVSLQEGIDSKRDELNALADVWAEHELELPNEIRLDLLDIQLTQDIILLRQIKSEVSSVEMQRLSEFDNEANELVAIAATISIMANEGFLVGSSSAIYQRINQSRDRIERLGAVDVQALWNKISLLQSQSAIENSNFVLEGVSYPEIEDFVPTIFPILIVEKYMSSLIQLLIQIMLDFGYTLILVIAVSQLGRRRST